MLKLPKVALLVMAVSLIGQCCVSSRRSPKLYAPDEIKGMVYHAMNEAKACIESKGTPLRMKQSVRLVVKPGTRRIGGYWTFYSEAWRMYIMGYYDGRNIVVAHNPANPLDINFEVLKHEFGHYWLITNYGWDHYPTPCKHDPRYRNCFLNWVIVRAGADGDRCGFILDNNGNPIHIQGIRISHEHETEVENGI